MAKPTDSHNRLSSGPACLTGEQYRKDVRSVATERLARGWGTVAARTLTAADDSQRRVLEL